MDFSNRGGQQPAAPVAAPQHTAKVKRLRGSKGMRVISSILLVSVALLVAALAIFIATGGNNPQSDLIKNDKYQAVFLNGGQVYFGKIKSMNDKYLTIGDIYYLRVNDQTQNQSNANQQSGTQQDISLAKLGCELHGPEDTMVINQDQVTFWENLKDDGQVVKAISEFVKANPDGQKCATS